MSVQFTESRYMRQDFVTNYAVVSESPIRFRADTVPASRVTTLKVGGDVYIAIEGERYRDIAVSVYGEDHYWWILCDANPGIPLDNGLFGLQAGAAVIVPSKEIVL